MNIKVNGINIFHFDVYRLEDSFEFYEIGGDEYFEKGICLIEWGELISDALPSQYMEIQFHKDEKDNNIRYIDLIAHGSNYEMLLDKLKKELF